MNADVPPFEALLRAEFAYDDQSHHGEYIDVLVHAITSIEGMAIGWWCLTSRGALFGRFPLHAFCWKRFAPKIPLDHLELWDCFSYEPRVHVFGRLDGARVRTVLKDRSWHEGIYRFTIDWCKSWDAEAPGETGWKCAHIIQLDNGCFAAQPNNRILWCEPSWVTNPYRDGERPDYLVQSRDWKVESESKWVTEDGDAWFYDVKDDGGRKVDTGQRFCAYCDDRQLSQPADVPGVPKENTTWLCNHHAMKLLRSEQRAVAGLPREPAK